MAFEMKQTQFTPPSGPFAAPGNIAGSPFVLLLPYTPLREPRRTTSFQRLIKNFHLEQNPKHSEDETAKGGPSFRRVRACLFDMDGLLLDTEDIYTLCNNVILHQCGRPSLPWNIKAQLQGRPGPEAGDIFHAWAQLPISREEYMVQISALQRMNFPSAQPLPGVPNLLADLEAAGIYIALATSSHAINYKLKTSHLQSLFSYFPARNRVLGDDSRIPKGRGKPAPDIYLLALETINAELREKREKEILPEECLVFEDSVPGVEAGRRAGMRVIWCPHPELFKIYKGRQKEVLAGITGMSKRNDEEVEEILDEAGVPVRVKGRPGAVDDGWAERLTSLVHFPYKKYGIVV